MCVPLCRLIYTCIMHACMHDIIYICIYYMHVLYIYMINEDGTYMYSVCVYIYSLCLSVYIHIHAHALIMYLHVYINGWSKLLCMLGALA